jgi:hypothetical protein
VEEIIYIISFLEIASKEFDLEVNTEKTKHTSMSEH